MDMIRRGTLALATLVLAMGTGHGVLSAAESGTGSVSQQLGDERVVSEPTESHLPGNRMVLGRIDAIRGGQMEIDIGNPQPLFVPMQPAHLKGQQFKDGDPIVVTLNDHNAVVDYHHPQEASTHKVLKGRLSTPLTVGLDKAVIETEQGTQSFMVADRAKAKLGAIPVGVEALFMADETGQLVDAQLASRQALQKSAQNEKAKIKGAHEQLRAVFQGTGEKGRIKITEQGRERELPVRPPLEKVEQLKPGQDVVLLMDDQGYVMEIATPDVIPTR